MIQVNVKNLIHSPLAGDGYGGYGFHPLASTMYELVDGTMYTYYCTQDSGCDATDWDLLDTTDAIPNPDFYTFTNDTLTINDGPGAHVNFECNGNIAIFNDNTVSYLSLIHISEPTRPY